MPTYQIKNSIQSVILELNRESILRGKVIENDINKKVAAVNSEFKIFVREKLRLGYATDFRTFLACGLILKFIDENGIEKFSFDELGSRYQFDISDIIKSVEAENQLRRKLYPIWIYQKKFGLTEPVAKNRIELLEDAILILEAVAAVSRNPFQNITIFSNT